VKEVGTMALEEVMKDIPFRSWRGERNIPVRRIIYDTRKVETGDLFCTWVGRGEDGNRRVNEAIDKGAVAIIMEREPEEWPECPCIVVGSGRRTLGLAAANRWKHPATSLRVIGITGTNGKSSTAFLLHHFLEWAGIKSGLIGTIEYRLGDRVEPAVRTTPEGSDIHEMMATMREAGCSSAVMEVSSHALDQGRVEGIAFAGALFTNLSPDHLDYHRDMESYFLAKARLFQQIAPGGFAVLPFAGDYGKRLRDMLAEDVRPLTYGMEEGSDSLARDVRTFRTGTSFIWEWENHQREVIVPWIGQFNLENTLAAMTAAVAIGCDPDGVVKAAEDAPAVPGRLQRVGQDELFTILVDYAHTEDALKNVLKALLPLKETRIRTLIGCGGDRDQQKRPKMARVACDYSDEVIFTTDNPRNENPAVILEHMLAGVEGRENYRVIQDRREAIEEFIETAVKGDIILIAGKGHESYQEINGIRHSFSDVEVVRACLKGGRP